MQKLNESNPANLEASLGVLTMSIASSAALYMGLSPDPQTGEHNVNLPMARFNIDLLLCLQEKTKGNLTEEEARLIDSIIQDIQLKFLTLKK